MGLPEAASASTLIVQRIRGRFLPHWQPLAGGFDSEPNRSVSKLPLASPPHAVTGRRLSRRPRASPIETAATRHQRIDGLGGKAAERRAAAQRDVV